MKINRVIVIVLDSMGVGEMPDADLWGDRGSNTLGNLAKAVGGVQLPNLAAMGLGKVTEVLGLEKGPAKGAYGKMAEQSYGKDTTTGHWEMAGIILPKEEAFPTYPKGFPPELIAEFEARIGRKTLGNEVASGTEIIQRLGDEHVRTGYPIVYTSADSVFQIAAHEGVVPLEDLYRYCEIAREMLTGPHRVGRVIARPFVGEKGVYTRTANRHDYAIAPFRPLIFNRLQEAGLEVAAVGKIKDIYHGEGISRHEPSKGNEEGVDKTLRLMDEVERGLIMTNLVDYDMLYGHRNDAAGYARALEAFDRRLPEIWQAMGPGDVLMITADHGCDPTTPSTDHSREYVPILICGEAIAADRDVGTRASFADLGSTVLDLLEAPSLGVGQSMADLIRKG